MSSIDDKLIQLAETKSNIKDAIIAKGVEVDSSLPFAQYADKIGEIPSGGEIEWADITRVGVQRYYGKGIFGSFANGSTSGSYFKDVWNTTKEPVILNIKFMQTQSNNLQHIFDLSGGFQLKLYNRILRSFSWRDNTEHDIMNDVPLNIWHYISIKIIPHEGYSDVEYYASTENFTTAPANLKASFEIGEREYSGTIGIEGYVFNSALLYGRVDMNESCVTDYNGKIIKRFFPL